MVLKLSLEGTRVGAIIVHKLRKVRAVSKRYLDTITSKATTTPATPALTMAQVPLDETFYHDPHLAQHWRSYFANDQVWVYHYFAASPFFDRSSNNGVIFTQAENNANMSQIVWSRQRFEDALRSLSGTEYMIAAGPPPSQYQGPDSGVWVVRKQDRRKRRSADGRTELSDEVTLLKTYYMCVERIYQAPAVGDIIGSKLVCIASPLRRQYITDHHYSSLLPPSYRVSSP